MQRPGRVLLHGCWLLLWLRLDSRSGRLLLGMSGGGGGGGGARRRQLPDVHLQTASGSNSRGRTYASQALLTDCRHTYPTCVPVVMFSSRQAGRQQLS
jgi:hypothetical protein